MNAESLTWIGVSANVGDCARKTEEAQVLFVLVFLALSEQRPIFACMNY